MYLKKKKISCKKSLKGMIEFFLCKSNSNDFVYPSGTSFYRLNGPHIYTSNRSIIDQQSVTVDFIGYLAGELKWEFE